MTTPSPAAPNSPENQRSRLTANEIRLHTIEADSLDEINREAFEEEASMFFSAQQRYLKKAQEDRSPNPPLQARVSLEKDLVENAEFRQTGDLSDILLSSRAAAGIQERLDSLREAQRGAERKSLDWHRNRKEIQTLKRAIMPYNHKLRDFLLENGSVLDFATMHQWISRAMGEKSATAGKILSGFQAEVATALLLSESGLSVRMSTIDEDLKKIDLVYQEAGGAPKKVDVKTGGNQGDGLANGVDQEIDIERQWLNGFSIKSEFKQSVLRQLRNR